MGGARPGRPRSTTPQKIESVALDLFARNGFAETTVEDIAAAAGISKRTFFRYYPSKNDVVWGDFDGLLRGMEGRLAETGDHVPLLEALSAAVIQFNVLPPEAVPAHRQRMSLILHVPALQAHSTLRYADWRNVVARFAARRLSQSADSLGPQLVGHLALGAALAAYGQWLGDESEDLGALLTQVFDVLDLRL